MNFREADKIFKTSIKIREAIKDCVTIAGTEALNHFTNSFRNQGFTDENLERWQPRKSDRVRDRKRGNRAILVKSGALRRSLFKYRSGLYTVTIKSPLPYASVHNEGLRSGRTGFKMPKRQFVGYSGVLARKIEKMIERKMAQAMK